VDSEAYQICDQYPVYWLAWSTTRSFSARHHVLHGRVLLGTASPAVSQYQTFLLVVSHTMPLGSCRDPGSRITSGFCQSKGPATGDGILYTLPPLRVWMLILQECSEIMCAALGSVKCCMDWLQAAKRRNRCKNIILTTKTTKLPVLNQLEFYSSRPTHPFSYFRTLNNPLTSI